MKTEIINFNKFISGANRAEKPKRNYIEVLDKNKGLIIKVCVLTGAVIFGVGYEQAFAMGIEEKAKELYFGKFIGVAKWIIVGKGGWDTVNKMLKEDFDGAKKCFLQYLVVFAILLGLPYGLDQIEEVFKEV